MQNADNTEVAYQSSGARVRHAASTLHMAAGQASAQPPGTGCPTSIPGSPGLELLLRLWPLVAICKPGGGFGGQEGDGDMVMVSKGPQS